jgi:hypothetical protein
LGGATALIALIAVAGTVFLRSLDRPWIKSRIQRLVRAASGLEIDYRAARIEWLVGAEIEGLVVLSPAEVRPFAPELLRVGCARVRWSLRSLLRGGGPPLESASLSDVTLTAVVDENGRTSFDAVTTPGSTGSPAVPLSRSAASILEKAPPLARLAIDRVALSLVRTDHGTASERAELRGLSLALTAAPAVPVPSFGAAPTPPAEPGWRARAELGTPERPLELELMVAHGGAVEKTARARLWITAEATPSGAAAAADLRMLEQTFAASVSADHWLHAEVDARFDPARGQTRISVNRVEAGDGAATMEASIEFPDAGAPVVRRAHGDMSRCERSRERPAPSRAAAR